MANSAVTNEMDRNRRMLGENYNLNCVTRATRYCSARTLNSLI